MALVWIRVLPEAEGRCVQLPADVKHRSVDGDTLLLTPGLSREVTKDEWDFLQAAHRDYLPSLTVLDNGQPAADATSEAADQPQ